MKTVIAIHGVGRPKPGFIAKRLAHTIGIREAGTRTLLLGGNEYNEISDLQNQLRVIEVNWSDLQRPKRTLLGLLSHVWLLLCAGPLIAAGEMKGLLGQRITMLFGWALLVLTPASVAFGVAAILGATFQQSIEYYLASVVLVGSTIVWASWTSRNLPWTYTPWAALFLVSFVVILASLDFPWGSREGLIRSVRQSYVLVQFPVYAFGWIAGGVVIAFQIKVRTWKTSLPKFALIYLPYVGVTSLTIIPMLVALYFSSRFGGDSANPFENFPVPYDLYGVELAATVAIAVVGLLPLAAVLVYFASRRRSNAVLSDLPPNKRGARVQDSIAVLLTVTPVIFFVVGLYYTYSLASHSYNSQSSASNILEIYKTSVLRILPYVGWFVGPLAIIGGVIGDVLLYLLPQELSRKSIAGECQNRLHLAIQYASQSGDDIVVVSHSQGSKIAADVSTMTNLKFSLITLGSPVSSLYQRFLGVESRIGQVEFINGYREGDYIAGPVLSAKNIGLGIGGHVDYWGDSWVQELIESVSKKTIDDST